MGRRCLDFKPRRDKGLQLDKNMETAILHVEASVERVRLLLQSNVIHKRWAFVVDEEIESEWVVVDEDQDEENHRSTKKTNFTAPSSGLSLYFHNHDMRRQWPPPFEFSESSIEDLHLSSQFVVSPSPLQPSRFYIVEWFSNEHILVHLALITPLSSSSSQIIFRYEYFLPDNLERSRSHFQNEMTGYWHARFLRLFRDVEWEVRWERG